MDKDEREWNTICKKQLSKYPNGITLDNVDQATTDLVDQVGLGPQTAMRFKGFIKAWTERDNRGSKDVPAMEYSYAAKWAGRFKRNVACSQMDDKNRKLMAQIDAELSSKSSE